jgi:hypothetical protein
MHFKALLAAAALVAAMPAAAAETAQQTAMKNCAGTWKTMSAADKAKSTYTQYMGSCMKGGANTAAEPAASSTAMSAKPAMSSGSMMMAAPGHAKCKDGTTVSYKKRSGTCSGHGGVASWM